MIDLQGGDKTICNDDSSMAITMNWKSITTGNSTVS